MFFFSRFFFQIREWFEARVVRGEGTGDLEEGAEETLGKRRKVGWRLHRGQSRKRRRHRWWLARRLQRWQRRLSRVNHRGPGINSRRKSHLRQSHRPFLSSQGQRTCLEIDIHRSPGVSFPLNKLRNHRCHTEQQYPDGNVVSNSSRE